MFLVKDKTGRSSKPYQLSSDYIKGYWDLDTLSDNDEELREYIADCEVGDKWRTYWVTFECLSVFEDAKEPIIKEKMDALMYHFQNEKIKSAYYCDDYDDEFEIFGERLEVVTEAEAFSNMEDYDGVGQFSVSENQIGFYTRLLGSDYFFKWL